MFVYHELRGMVELNSTLAEIASIITEIDDYPVNAFSQTIIDLMLSGF